MQMKPEFQVLIAAILLGSIGILTKLIGTDVHPTVIAFYRVFFAALILAILCPIVDKTTFRPAKKDLGMFAVIGLIFAVSITLIIIAYSKAPIQNVTLLSSITPFFVLIIAYFLLKERITKTKILTLVIAIIGLIIMLGVLVIIFQLHPHQNLLLSLHLLLQIMVVLKRVVVLKREL